MLHLLLAAAAPLQTILDKTSPTHRFINQQALVILKADGKTQAAAWLHTYLNDLCLGCNWADGGWRNVSHMYDPYTGTGLRGWPNAPETLGEYWNRAARSFAELNHAQSFFYLGAACHLVQDLCVPHHAAAKVFAGHQKFEAYARRYRHRYAVHEGGCYDTARTPEGWVIHNADYTRRHYSHCLSTDVERPTVHAAVSDLLPRAQRSTAGFISYFLKRNGVS